MKAASQKLALIDTKGFSDAHQAVWAVYKQHTKRLATDQQMDSLETFTSNIKVAIDLISRETQLEATFGKGLWRKKGVRHRKTELFCLRAIGGRERKMQPQNK